MKIVFTGILNDTGIADMAKCLHLPINNLRMERGSFYLDQESSFAACLDPLTISFQMPDKGFRHLQIESVYEDHQWIGYQGKLNIKVYDEPWRPLAERVPELQSVKQKGATLNSRHFSPISEILCYGNALSGFANDLDTDLNSTTDTTEPDFPFIELQSIEFLVLKHDNQKETLLILDCGGFEIHVCDNALELEKQRGHGKYMRNIVLQHKIG